MVLRMLSIAAEVLAGVLFGRSLAQISRVKAFTSTKTLLLVSSPSTSAVFLKSRRSAWKRAR